MILTDSLLTHDWYKCMLCLLKSFYNSVWMLMLSLHLQLGLHIVKLFMQMLNQFYIVNNISNRFLIIYFQYTFKLTNIKLQKWTFGVTYGLYLHRCTKTHRLQTLNICSTLQVHQLKRLIRKYFVSTAENTYFNGNKTSMWTKPLNSGVNAINDKRFIRYLCCIVTRAFGCYSMLTNLSYVLLCALFWWCFICIVISCIDHI